MNDFTTGRLIGFFVGLLSGVFLTLILLDIIF